MDLQPPDWLAWSTSSTGVMTSRAIRGPLRLPPMTPATVRSLGAAIGLGGAKDVLSGSTNSSAQASFSGEHCDYAIDLARPTPARTASVAATGAAGPGDVGRCARRRRVALVHGDAAAGPCKHNAPYARDPV